MEPELPTIHKLRRQHLSLLDRLEGVAGWVKRRKDPPAPGAVRAVQRLVAELNERLLPHLREEECLSCPSFRTCRSPRQDDGCPSGPKPPRAAPHLELLRMVDDFVRAAPQSWPEAATRFGPLEKALLAHVRAEEAGFRATALAPKPGRRD
ncbi:MAG: hemerythrin domain-containing protein [Myxococcales bacterium]|nr:hemerythrin domain-containing protein [Myxococcales bacterium]